MKHLFTLLLIATLLASCGQKPDTQKSLPFVGTWQLISATSTERDSTFSTFNAKNEMIKIITPTHFAFFNHDLQQGKDSTSAFYVAGGGEYTLKDSVYTEHLQYFIDRAWEDHKFEFVVKIQNDTLTQSGVERIEKLGIDRVIVEKYVRVKR